MTAFIVVLGYQSKAVQERLLPSRPSYFHEQVGDHDRLLIAGPPFGNLESADRARLRRCRLPNVGSVGIHRQTRYAIAVLSLEHDASVRQPVRVRVRNGVVRELPLLAAVTGYNPDFRVGAVDVPGEHDPLAVWDQRG
jgi:hypothetical protein